MYEQIVVLIVILATLVMFSIGKLRYDFVALLSVVVLVILKVIEPEEAFKGFSHPAVITVASVLILSSSLVKTGAVDKLVVLVNKGPKYIQFKILILMSITALLSAFMNNIGALAIIVPIALKIAKDGDLPPSKILMPVAFSSLLGGMITGIGTPPNLIISQYRIQSGGEAFGFFDFAPVGLGITIIGILFTSFIGWKLIPIRKGTVTKERFNLDDFLFELVVTNKCDENGIKLKDFHSIYGIGINVVSILRGTRQILSPGGSQTILRDDILIVKSGSDTLNEVLQKTCLELKGAEAEKLVSKGMLRGEDVALVEVVLRNDSPLIGRTAIETKLRNRYNANLVAVSRKGVTSIERLKTFKFSPGDILLLQVPRDSLEDLYSKLRCIPLTEKEDGLSAKPANYKQWVTLGVFGLSILLAAFNIIPIHISFLAATLILVISKVVTPREFYESIEWPTILMIGSLFTLGYALEVSGGSTTIANYIVDISVSLPNYVVLGILMLITIVLTNIINNNAATILVAPIAVAVAAALGISADPMLMAVVVGASTSFITPIAHQSNILVMGPGGYKFKDYWKLGLPLTIISILIGIPLILLIWPF